MKNIILFLLLLLPAITFAQEADYSYSDAKYSSDSLIIDTIPTLPWPQNLQAELDSLCHTNLFNTTIGGIQIYDLTADSLLFSYNEKLRLRPASTMKMVVSVAALEEVGSTETFNTKFGYNGHIKTHKYMELQEFGDTLIDVEVVRHTLNGNLYVKGGMDPMFSDTNLREIVNKLKDLQIDTINGNLYTDLSFKDNIMYGKGWCWDDKNPVLTPLLVDKKDVFCERFLKYLQDNNIVFLGEVKNADYNTKAKTLYQTSHEVKEVMKRMLKNSDNLHAECIFYKLASKDTNKKRVSAVDGRNAVYKMIRKAGLNPANYYVADGSGLSLYNILSAELEVAVLKHAYKNNRVFYNLYDLLPIAGVDGTIASRMKDSKAYNNVRAKTGTLSNVSSLTGYCISANGHWLCFSIINNNIISNDTGKKFQDKICAAMCTFE